MTGESEAPRAGVKYGKGTRTKGRLSNAPPPDPHTVVGNKRPPFDVIGTDALSPLIEYVDFPATREEINARIGDIQVPIDRERTRPVREILNDVTPTTFQSGAEVEQAVSRLWDTIADRRGRGGRQPQEDNLNERSRID